MYNLQFFGTLLLEKEGSLLPKLRSRKVAGLLAYLSRHNGPVQRSELAHIFWPDLPEKRGRRNLSREMSYLSDLLPDCFESDFHTIKFQPGDLVWSDVDTFEQLLSQAKQAEADADLTTFAANLSEAIALYRGKFFSGHYLPNCPDYEIWLVREQEYWEQQAVVALSKLVNYQQQQPVSAQAIAMARRWLQLDPLHEEAIRHLMLLLTKNSQPETALQQYRLYRHNLQQELDMTPSAELSHLFHRIKEQPQTFVENHSDQATLPASPYQGLATFTEFDAAFFFGRDAYIPPLVEAVTHHPFTAVIGPSGIGKSSLIFAGLIPHLKRDPNTTWQTIVMRSGDDPFQSMAAALIAHISPSPNEPNAKTLAATLRQEKNWPDNLLPQILTPSAGQVRLLIILDQFEELCIRCSDPDIKYQFIDTLLAMSQASAVSLVLTVRADFISQILMYRPMADILQQSNVILGPMTSLELHQIIVEPAKLQGVSFESGLADRILSDVGEQPGNLPLLEFALTNLWQEQAEIGPPLSHAVYERIGKVTGAISDYANRFYQSLTEQEQSLTRQVLMQMIYPGINTDDTRRLAYRHELGEAGWRLVQKLADARLVVTGHGANGEEIAEIAHEALIKNWGQLSQWIDEDRVFRSWQERLRAALHQWEVTDRNPDSLLRGVPLSEAEGWTETHATHLSSVEHEFITAGVRLRDAEITRIEAQHQLELTQTQALVTAEYQRAEAESRGRQRLKWLAVGLTLMMILTAATSVWALQQQRQMKAEVVLRNAAEADALQARDSAELAQAAAEEQAVIALSRQLSAQTIALQEKQPDLAMLLSLESIRLAQTEQARGDLLAQLKINPNLQTFLHEPIDVFEVAVSPDGQVLATARGDGQVGLWDLNTAQQIETIQVGELPILTVAFHPNGNILAFAGDETVVTLWDITAGQVLNTLRGHSLTIFDLAFSPNGQLLASADREGQIILWDVVSGEAVGQPLTNHTDRVESVAFNPTGTLLASASSDQTVRLWNVATGQPVGEPLTAHAGTVSAVSFNPDGTLLASAGQDNAIILWNTTTWQPVGRPLIRHSVGVKEICFSPDGKTLASASSDKTIILWDVATGQSLGAPLVGHAAEVGSIAFSPDGHKLFSGGQDYKAIIWDLDRPHLLAAHQGSVRHVALSPDGIMAASGDKEGKIVLLNVQTGQAIGDPFQMPIGDIRQLAFSPDSGQLISVGEGTSRLWDLATNQDLYPDLFDPVSNSMSVVFHPTNHTVAIGSDQGQITLWDLDAGELKATLDGHSDSVRSLAFNSNGSWLASTGDDGQLIVWNMTTEQPLLSALTPSEMSALTLAFSPDDKILASGGKDTLVTLWDAATLTVRQELGAHTRGVNTLTFAPDGQRLISGSSDNTLIVWNIATGQPMMPPLIRHIGSVKGLAMDMTSTGDVLKFVSGSSDHLTGLWTVRANSWAEHACQIVNRKLTQAEWETFIGSETPYQPTCNNLF